MGFLFWALIGALIGGSAAKKRGLGTASGVVGGMLLGPLAVLMFFVSGDRKRCPECDEWISKKAKNFPHCKSQLGASVISLFAQHCSRWLAWRSHPFGLSTSAPGRTGRPCFKTRHAQAKVRRLT